RHTRFSRDWSSDVCSSDLLLGDLGTDHQGFPPTPVIAGSPDVLIDGKPVARVGDPLAPHSKPKHPPHPRAIAAGSATVLINGIRSEERRVGKEWSSRLAAG